MPAVYHARALIGLTVTAVLVVGTVVLVIRARRMGPEVPRCVACGSPALTVLAREVYTCRACGHEGGAGRPLYDLARTRAAWAGRPWAERLASARDDLRVAARELEALEPVRARVARHDPFAWAKKSEYDDPELVEAQHTLLGGLAGVLGHVREAAGKVPGLEAPDPEAILPVRIEPETVAEVWDAVEGAVVAAARALKAAATP